MNTQRPNPTPCSAHATAYEHVGIRVSDPELARRFYERLGFHEEIRFDDYANEMATPAGVRINLIFNGKARTDAPNVLQDEPMKWPGLTHVAFVVDDPAGDRLGDVAVPGGHFAPPCISAAPLNVAPS